MTSHDAVNIVRRLTGVRRVGHTGTLDPMVTGVLPICIGNATRIIEYMDRKGSPDAKSYRCDMKLGYVSDTQDIWGQVMPCAEPNDLPSEREICEALEAMVGAYVQTTPLYSAAKYKGKPLYAYARTGIPLPEEAVKKRNVYINKILVNQVDCANAMVQFDVDCSSGTYVRTICHDLGQRLGCGAIMSGLIRTQSCGFRIEDSYTPEQLETMKDALPILPADSALKELPAVVLNEDDAKLFRNGMKIPFGHQDQSGDAGDAGARAYASQCVAEDEASAAEPVVRVYADRRFIGIGKCESDQLKPHKVIDNGE
jgi:tRNA pseudouridine55 synthase